MGLSSREVQDRTFSTAIRGYDRAQVDAFVGSVANHMSKLEEDLTIATAKAERARGELERLHDVLDARVEETHQARAAILEEARAEATAIVAAAEHADGGNGDAARRAGAIIAEAEAKAEIRLREIDAIRTQAEAEAAELRRQTEQAAELRMAEADRVLDEARREARDIRRGVEADRSAAEHQLRRLRAIVSAVSGVEEQELADVRIELGDGGDVVVDLTESTMSRSLT